MNMKFHAWARGLLLSSLVLSSANGNAVIPIGGIDFADNAFADRVLSTDFTGVFEGCGGQLPSSLTQAVAGNNLATWADYGAHDLLPGEDGRYDSAAPPVQYIELGFVDNVVVNRDGPDFVIFEATAPNAVRVALDKASIQDPYAINSKSVIAQPVSFGYTTGCIQVAAAYVDLSDFGVANNASVYRVFISSPLMENGDIAWVSDSYPWLEYTYSPLLGVPEVAGAAALHSEAKSNYSPEVDVGEDISIHLPVNTVTLSGDVMDDGLPADSLSYSWIQTGGAEAVIASPSSKNTTVTFSEAGTYEFELTVSDSSLNDSDRVTVVVGAEDSENPPVPTNFSAESMRNRRIYLTWESSSVDGEVVSYNIYRNGELRATTKQLFFQDININWSESYSYYIRAVDPADNLSEPTSPVTVTLSAPLVVSRIAAGADNAEECPSGVVTLNNNTLDLGVDGVCGNQLVGLRFASLGIPERAMIQRAWLQFYTDTVGGADTDLLIEGIAEDSAAPFEATNGHIALRTRTDASVEWSDVPAWNAVGGHHESIDISLIVQELTDRTGWRSGQAMGFVISGTGLRIAESFRALERAPRLFVEYFEPNQAPVVNAGSNVTITLPDDDVTLTGIVTDDGVTGVPTVLWSLDGGPASVSFSAATATTTDVTFTEAGEYVLKLEADDGEYTSSATVMVTVLAEDTDPPTVPQNLTARNAGAGRVTLNWNASSDNRGGVAGYRVYRGVTPLGTVSGLSFSDSGLASDTEYTYTVAAVDQSNLVSAASDPETIRTIYVPNNVSVLNVPISATGDDAEETGSRTVYLNSSTLELVYRDTSPIGNQTTGLRFSNVLIPSNAVITSAYFQFMAEGASSSATSLIIQAIDESNVSPFVAEESGNISGRSLVGNVAWANIDPWAANTTYASVDISGLIQERVNSDQWQSGNAMGFVITGTGARHAMPRDDGPSVAPILHIEYYGGDVPNVAPTVNSGEDVTIELSDGPVTLTGSVNDDDMSEVTLSWSRISGPGVVFSPEDEVVTEVTFSSAGTYLLQLEANDGEFTSTDEVTVTVTEPDDEAPSAPSNLRVTHFGATSVFLSWVAANDNVAVSNYRIYRDGAPLATASGLTYVDSGLMENTTYSYQVAALDAADNESELLTAVSIMTPSTPEPAEIKTLNIPIRTTNDDVEQASETYSGSGGAGAVFLTSSTLDLVTHSNDVQKVGLRFANVRIPANAIITNAYLQFQAAADRSDTTSLTIAAFDTSNVAAFTATAHDVSNRNVFGSVSWSSIPSWTRDTNYPSANIAGLVQSFVSNPDWVGGNAMGFMISGSGVREAKTFGTVPPILHIEYFDGDENLAPAVNLGLDRTVTLPDTLLLPVSVVDAFVPAEGGLSVTFTQVTGPRAVTPRSDDAGVTVTFPEAGTYVLRVTADDGELTGFDEVTVIVNAASGGGGGGGNGSNTGTDTAGGGGGGSLDLWSLLVLLLAGGFRFGSVRAGRRRLSGGCSH